MQYEKENCFFDKCCRKGIKKGSTEPSLISFFAYNKAAHFAVGIKTGYKGKHYIWNITHFMELFSKFLQLGNKTKRPGIKLQNAFFV